MSESAGECGLRFADCVLTDVPQRAPIARRRHWNLFHRSPATAGLRITVAALIAAHLSGLPHAHAQVAPPLTTARVDDAASQPPSALSGDERLLHWRQVFFWAGVLLFIFLISAGVIIRFSKRYRAYMLREPPPPTPSEDVWRMHRLPKDDGGTNS